SRRRRQAPGRCDGRRSGRPRRRGVRPNLGRRRRRRPPNHRGPRPTGRRFCTRNRYSNGVRLTRPAVLLGLAAFASPAAPGEPNAGIEHGVALREQGHDEEALAEFRKAYAMAPTPRASAQMGLAEQALGLWVAAEEHVREALKSAGDPWIQKNRAVLEQSLRAIDQHLGTLEVRGLAGAELFVDGARVGQLPLERGLRIEAGHRTLEVRALGFQSTSRTIIVSPGETARETIELRPNPVALAPGVGGEPSTQANEPRTHEGREHASNGTQRTVGWVLT